jgi:predicted DCC family thiol-disulfide oxidoreductase YuxK
MNPKPARIEMYYDGRCGWCRAGVNRLKRLDWFHALQAIDYTTLESGDRPVPEEVFEKGMPLRTRDGRLLIGFRAVRHALIHTPPGWIVGWILYVPGLSQLGASAYAAFARRRPRDAPSTCRLERVAGLRLSHQRQETET